MKLKTSNSNNSISQFKIPKDISKLPVLSMLIKTKRLESHSSSDTNLTFSKSKTPTLETKVCKKHTNEKLLYLCEAT